MFRCLNGGRIAVALAMSASLGLALTESPTPASAATQRSFCYTGFSYGTRVFVGTSVTSGPSAPSQIGCTRGAPLARTNTMAHVSLAGTVSSGVLDTAARTTASPVLARSTATLHGVNLLGGAITATLLRAESWTQFGKRGFRLGDTGTTFVALKVRGKPINVGARRNVRVAVRGIGYVVLNQQAARRSSTSASLVVDAIHVVVTATNVPGAAAGTNVVVGHAMSGLQGPVIGLLGGEAYGTSMSVGRVVHSGPSFLNPMPCLGSHGVLFVRGGAGLDKPGSVATGADRNTVMGTVGPTFAAGTLTSTVQGVTLLGGIVHATVIRATARMTKVGSTIHLANPGSSFATLTVRGFPSIGANVPTNTRVALPGVGTLYLHRVIFTPRSVEVRMIELVVTHSNAFGLAVGTDLRIAVAHGTIR